MINLNISFNISQTEERGVIMEENFKMGFCSLFNRIYFMVSFFVGCSIYMTIMCMMLNDLNI